MYEAAGPGSSTSVSRDAATRLLLYAATALAFLCASSGDPLREPSLAFLMIGGTFHRPAGFLAALPASLLLLLWAFHRSAAVRAGTTRPPLLGGGPAWGHFRRVLLFGLVVFLLFPRRIFLTATHAP